MDRVRRTAIGAFAALLAGSALGHAESLQEALGAAYATNSSLQAQRAALRATDEAVPQALANWRPTVRINGDVGDWNLYNNSLSINNKATAVKIPPPTNNDQDVYAQDGSLTVSEPLYRGGRTVSQTEQAEAQVKAGRAVLQNTEQTVLLAAVTAYMDVVQNRAVVQLNQKNEDLLARQLTATSDRLKVGQATRTDLAQAQAAVAGAHAAVVQAQGTLANSEATFADVVGHEPGNLDDAGPVAGLPASLDQARRAALSDNPQVAAQGFNLEVAQRSVDVAFGALLPTVSLNGTYTKIMNETYNGTTIRQEEATVNVQMPLYQGGAEYAGLRALKQTVSQQQLLLDQARHDAVQSATSSWDALAAAQAQVQSLQSQVDAAQVALDGIQKQYEVGASTILDVLTSAQNLLTAQVNLVRAQHDRTVASYQVRGAVGLLTAQALKLPVALYDPTVHYYDVRDRMVGLGGDSSASSGTGGH